MVCSKCSQTEGPLHECDSWDVTRVELGYVYCRPHEEWHRPPECAIDQAGEPLMWCGCRWVDVDEHPFDGHRISCDLHEADPK